MRPPVDRATEKLAAYGRLRRRDVGVDRGEIDDRIDATSRDHDETDRKEKVSGANTE